VPMHPKPTKPHTWQHISQLGTYLSKVALQHSAHLQGEGRQVAAGVSHTQVAAGGSRTEARSPGNQPNGCSQPQSSAVAGAASHIAH
jgi:hypothetical protein